MIPKAYRNTAVVVTKRARDMGKPVIALIWEIVNHYLEEEKDLGLPSFPSRGKPLNRQDLYDEHLARKIR